MKKNLLLLTLLALPFAVEAADKITLDPKNTKTKLDSLFKAGKREEYRELHKQYREAHQQQLKEREAQPFIDEHNAWVAVEEDYKEAYKITQIREEEAQRKAQRDAEKAQRQKEEAQRAADRQARREAQQALELAKLQEKIDKERVDKEAERAAKETARELQREAQLATGAAAAASKREEHIGLDLAHMAKLVKLTDERVVVSVHLCPNCSTYNPKKACLVQPINRALNKDEKRAYETIQTINRDLQKANKNPQQKVTIPFPQKGMAPYESFLEQVGIFDNKMAIIDAIAILNPLETILSKSWEHVGPSKQPAEPVNENTLSTQEQQEPLAASASPSVVIKKQPGEKLPVSCDLDAFLNLLDRGSKKTMNVINQTGDSIDIKSIIESEVKEKTILPTQFNLLEIRPYSGFHLPSGKFIIIENYQENKIFFALVVFVQKDANGRFVETAYCIDRNGIILDPATTGITLKHEDEDDLTF